jgi:predicted TIM-barrel fold metal-dependent hydrolase
MTALPPVTRLPEIMPPIGQNPDLTVVIDHMADSPLAQPGKLDLLLAPERYPKVCVKISHMGRFQSRRNRSRIRRRRLVSSMTSSERSA